MYSVRVRSVGRENRLYKRTHDSSRDRAVIVRPVARLPFTDRLLIVC